MQYRSQELNASRSYEELSSSSFLNETVIITTIANEIGKKPEGAICNARIIAHIAMGMVFLVLWILSVSKNVNINAELITVRSSHKMGCRYDMLNRLANSMLDPSETGCHVSGGR